MASKNSTAEEIPEYEITLGDLSKLEQQFATVELAQQRAKEYALRPLYCQRQATISRLRSFWSTITSFDVERFEISESGTHGDPRSLRIIFDFAPNDLMEDVRLVKELKYRHATRGNREGLISDPVPIRWKSKKKDLTRGLGPSAMSLFEAEKALKMRVNDEEVDVVSREGLWQSERVLQGLRTMDGLGQRRLGFFAWFYYRGVDLSSQTQEREGEDVDQAHLGEEESSDDGLRDAEIFPEGSDLANFLAEHLWEDAVNIYVDALKPTESETENESRDALDKELSHIQGADGDAQSHAEDKASVMAPRADRQVRYASPQATSGDVPPKRKKPRKS